MADFSSVLPQVELQWNTEAITKIIVNSEPLQK